MTPSNPLADLPRLVLTTMILMLFGYAVIEHYGVGLEEVLKNIVVLAVGYWLGSSKGSTDKSAQLADTGASGKPNDPVNVEVKP